MTYLFIYAIPDNTVIKKIYERYVIKDAYEWPQTVAVKWRILFK